MPDSQFTWNFNALFLFKFQSEMKPEQSNENRLDGTVLQQVSEHQNNMNIGMMDMGMSMMMSSNTQQQITSVPMDNSGSSVQNVQPVAGPSTQTTHDQITQNQTDAPTQQEDEEESSEEEDNSDDECEGDEGTFSRRLSYFLTRKSVENMFPHTRARARAHTHTHTHTRTQQ